MEFLNISDKIGLSPILYMVMLVVGYYMFMEKHINKRLDSGKIDYVTFCISCALMVFLFLSVANFAMISHARAAIQKALPIIMENGIYGGNIHVEEIDFTQSRIKGFYENQDTKNYIILSFTDYVHGGCDLLCYAKKLLKEHPILYFFMMSILVGFFVIFVGIIIEGAKSIKNHFKKVKIYLFKI